MSMILLGISAVSAENTTHSITDTPTVSTNTADMSKTVSTKTVAENTEVSENTYINHAYQEATRQSAKHNPYVEKVEWLSGTADNVCDLCKERNGKKFDNEQNP